jgi:hypothetical protein
MSDWVAQEKAMVYYPGTEPFETVGKWTPAPGNVGWKLFGDFRDLAAFGKFR